MRAAAALHSPERVGRRQALRLGLLGTTWLLTGGHAPYGQWSVYRKRYLLILTTRADPPSFELGKQLAALLVRRLPESKARVSRAPHKERIASLISSKQMDVALMRHDDAAALRRGTDPFADYGPVPLRTIVGVGDYLLVCRDDYPARHTWLIAETLSEDRDAIALPLSPVGPDVEPPDARVPLHSGARVYFTGGPLPDREPQEDPDQNHEHEHGADTTP